ncbi:MAG: peptidylprolyl isomerase [Oligoflexia bacterium]|nr:peptidylprolyl isomerase [Oligoflexia bacterium]
MSQVIAESDPPFNLPPKQELQKLQSAIIYTGKGEIYFELYPQDAPWHVANFKYLADKGFYRNRRFHLYYPGYVIQGGSPDGKPSGGPGYSLPAEFNKHPHELGTLGMARQPDYINPERRSNGSQFHILLSDAPHMDGAYTVFGKVVKGLNVLQKLRKDDLIQDIKVYISR